MYMTLNIKHRCVFMVCLKFKASCSSEKEDKHINLEKPHLSQFLEFSFNEAVLFFAELFL